MRTIGYKVTTIGAKSANTREILGETFGVVFASKAEAEIAAAKMRESVAATWLADLWYVTCRIEGA